MRRWLFNILAGLSLLICVALLAAGALTRSRPFVAWHKHDVTLPSSPIKSAHYRFVTIKSGYAAIGARQNGRNSTVNAEEHRQLHAHQLEQVDDLLRSNPERADIRDCLLPIRARLQAKLAKADLLAADGIHVGRDDYFHSSRPELLPGGGLTNDRESVAWAHAGISFQRQIFAGEHGHFFRIVLPIWMLAALLLIAPLLRAAPIWASVRRQRRMRRGLCAHCGYDIRASHGRCPECGEATTQSSPSTPPVPS